MEQTTLDGLIDRLEKYRINPMGMSLEDCMAASEDLLTVISVLKGLKTIQGKSEKMCPYLAEYNAHSCMECPSSLNIDNGFCPFSVDSFIGKLT